MKMKGWLTWCLPLCPIGFPHMRDCLKIVITLMKMRGGFKMMVTLTKIRDKNYERCTGGSPHVQLVCPTHGRLALISQRCRSPLYECFIYLL